MFAKRVRASNNFKINDPQEDVSTDQPPPKIQEANFVSRLDSRKNIQGIRTSFEPNRDLSRDIDQLLTFRKLSEDSTEERPSEGNPEYLYEVVSDERDLRENTDIGIDQELIFNVENLDDENIFENLGKSEFLQSQLNKKGGINEVKGNTKEKNKKTLEHVDVEFLMNVKPKIPGRVMSDAEEDEQVKNASQEKKGKESKGKTKNRIAYQSEIIAFERSVIESSIGGVFESMDSAISKAQLSIDKNNNNISNVK
jgi:hypothetical protein